MAVILFEASSANRTGTARHALVAKATSSTAVLLASSAGFVVAFVAAYLLFVRTGGGRLAENGVVHSAQSVIGSTVDWAAPLGAVDMVGLLAVVAVGVLLIALVRRRFSLGVSALVVLAAPLMAAQLLKLYVLERPGGRDGLAVAGHNSFPSGHVSAATAILLAVVVVLPRRFRTPVLLLGAPVVAWVAASTIALGWHRLSDTLGGCLLVAALACAGAALMARRGSGAKRIPAVPVSVGLFGPVAVVLGDYAVLSTATSASAQYVAALVLAAVSAAAVVLLVAIALHGVSFERRLTGSAREQALIASSSRDRAAGGW
ncbi:phosphatase PAP2 family protein [Amycolatopsis sp. H20-H5]|uniref:phosphatase PAP2 family protein n=1 Tax=Amycolatopsis sp. H20-H5 TaxID=3046309 RepID=UPI002DB92D1B|nr:phosphatase PAP2 family protein [Amycolatopsis sp. H20-H5]MEC3982503.1 phosphatase PAP2 family protein [Amycolatopsis sp. H20-H5]